MTDNQDSNNDDTDDDYYDFFDRLSNGGKVFVPDEEKKVERENWKEISKQINEHYLRQRYPVPPEIVTANDLLSQRLMSPCLDVLNPATHSYEEYECRERRYPPKIYKWVGFRQHVESYIPKIEALSVPRVHIFQKSIDYAEIKGNLCNEEGEKHYLHDILRAALVLTNIISDFRLGAHSNSRGSYDAFTQNGDQLALPIEFKATHDLPLPIQACGIARIYNEAYIAQTKPNHKPTEEQYNICFPIGQIAAYMVENGRRYGVLTSATRTYFLWIDNKKLRISDAWFIGQKNFLRAWAYVHNQACKQRVLLNGEKDLSSWIFVSALDFGSKTASLPNAVRSNKKQKTRNQMSRKSISSPVPELPHDSFQIIEPLGHGRNGTVLLAKWRGQKIALKQFDLSKHEERFEKEIAAYQYLKPAWGSLVVTPLFVSQSWYGWVKYIGFQLGREPQIGKDSVWTESRKVVNDLVQQYDFYHEDADRGQNMVYIWDETTKTERLVAIDLEWYTILDE